MQVLRQEPVLLGLEDIATLLNTCLANRETLNRCRKMIPLIRERYPNLDTALEEEFQKEWVRVNPNRLRLELIIDLMKDPGQLLSEAIEREDLRRVSFLLDQGIRPNSLRFLKRAIYHDNPNLVRLLLQAGALVNHLDENDYTPLMYASTGGSVDIIKLLLDYGAQIDMQGCMGQTALMIALTHHNLAVAKYLIDRGADVNTIQNDHGYTSADYANRVKDDPELYQYLRRSQYAYE